jgi:hypothetical protein
MFIFYLFIKDSDPDLTVSDNIEDTNEDTVQQLREKIAQLEKEKAEQTAHIALLSKKVCLLFLTD